MLKRAELVPNRSPDYVRYARFGRFGVYGWLPELGLVFIDALESAQRDKGVEGHVAEIGVHHGKLFILLSLLRRPGERAVAIDIFEDQELNPDRSGHGDRGAFLSNLDRWHPQAPNVIVHQSDSREVNGAALCDLAGGRLRLVSVDGGHTADLTYLDLETASDALADGGLIILDDCFNELFPAVSVGAQRFLRDRRDIAAVGAAGNKTFLTQRAHAGAYRLAMASRAEELGYYHQEHIAFVDDAFHSVFPPQRQVLTDTWHRLEVWQTWTSGWLRYQGRQIKRVACRFRA